MIYLVEIEAHDGTVVRTLYLGTEGITTRPTDSPANAYYDPRIADPGNFETFLFGEGTTRGQSRIGAGDIVLRSGDPGNGQTLDPWLGWGFDGRPVTIKLLARADAAITTAETLFRGTAEQLVADRPMEQVALRLHDRLTDLDKPLLQARYAGTTLSTGPTAEGTADQKDLLKPRVWGRAFNVPALLVNPFDLIYQVSASPLQSIAVFDAGYPLTLAADYLDIASLRSATIVPGRYATCLALGLFRLGASAFKAVTADVVEGTQRTAAQIARRILLEFGIAPADAPNASFSALASQAPAEVGIYVSGEDTALSVVTRLLDSIGGWISPSRLGTFRVGRLAPGSGTPAAVFTESELLDEPERLRVLDQGNGIPAWRTTVRWGRINQVQGQNDLIDPVSTARRAMVASEWREAKVENAAVKTRYLNAPELIVETCLATQSDAETEAARLQALYGARRDRYRIKVHITEARAIDLGSVVMLRLARLGLSAGKLFVVIGRTDEYATDTVTLDLWS